MCGQIDCDFIAEPQDEDRDAWLAERKSCIGGSEISAILGNNPWKSALAVYEDKISESVEGFDNERMFWGRANEDTVAREISRRLGADVRRKNAIIRHPHLHYCGASIDRRFVKPDPTPWWWQPDWERVGLEVKTAGVDQRSAWMQHGPPAYYLDQCRWYLYVTGWDAWVIGCLFGGNELKTWLVERDADWESTAGAAAAAFWADVQLRNPPSPSGLDCDSEIIRQYFPRTVPLSEVEYSEPVERWLEQYRQAADDEKRSKKAKTQAAQELRLLLGDAESMKLPDGRGTITCKEDKNGNRRLRVPKAG